MTIKAHFRPGDTIEGAFIEAIRVAGILSCHIEFNFNGVICIAHKNGDAKRGVESYQTEIAKKDGSKVAFC